MARQSRNSVKIVGNQWSLVLPVGAGYDREVVLDHLTDAVQRHGHAELVAHNGRFSIDRAAGQSTDTCAACGSAARQIACRSGGVLLCVPCVLGSAQDAVRHRAAQAN